MVYDGAMTLSSKAICIYRESGSANRESGCSAVQNGEEARNVTTTAPRQRCESRNINRSNMIRDNRVSGWRTV